MRDLSPKMQEIVERISKDRLRLLESVEGLEPEATDFRPSPEAWSIGEVLHHLALADEASAKLMSVLLERGEKESILPDPDPGGSVLASIDDVVAGADEQKAPAPERVTPRSYVPAAEAIARLEASRKKILESLERLSDFDGTRIRHRHPFFGELDCYQWLLVSGWHERRHTRQIERVKKSAGFPR